MRHCIIGGVMTLLVMVGATTTQTGEYGAPLCEWYRSGLARCWQAASFIPCNLQAHDFVQVPKVRDGNTL